jgi:hypothetical protein
MSGDLGDKIKGIKCLSILIGSVYFVPILFCVFVTQDVDEVREVSGDVDEVREVSGCWWICLEAGLIHVDGNTGTI